MGTLLISLLTLVLLLISAFVILIVLMQRTSQNGGMGAALGGGAAESAFGSETNNILTKGTVYGIIAFFLVALGLYLLYQAQAADAVKDVDMNALISAKEEAPVAETHTAAVDFEGTSATLGESVESAVEASNADFDAAAADVETQVEQAVESVDAAVSDSLPSDN
jgi:preprotein translocase subunit SecG